MWLCEIEKYHAGFNRRYGEVAHTFYFVAIFIIIPIVAIVIIAIISSIIAITISMVARIIIILKLSSQLW